MTTLIEQLASAKGIANDYVDAWGNPALVTLDSKAAMLAAMGYKVDDEAALQIQLEDEKRQHWQLPIDPVMVVRTADAIVLELRLPITLVNEELTWEVATEQGDTVKGTLLPVDGEMVSVAHFADVEYQAYRVALSNELPLGYHELSLKKARKVLGTMRLIVAPKECYKQEPIANGRKVWGPSVQLYCLRSEKNWGVGDFTDLGLLVDNMAKWGAHFVGLNPIHALYPANPESASPYSPSSRRWLNVIYIEVTAVPEYLQNAAVKAEVESAAFQQRLQALRDKEWVDYTGVTEAKLDVLRKVFAGAKLAKNTNRGKAFAAFIAEGGDSLKQQAVYDALQASLYAEGQNAWGWPAWPEEFREYHKPAVAKWADEHESDVRFYMYLQFLADEQLAQADAIAKKSGMVMGIYRDLAVGVSEGSTEIWANSELYCPKASVGAPPDVLGPLGQNWGLPPMDPSKLLEAKYQPMIDLFRSNMRSCGSLRIDHAMALLRLWWVPPGASAANGAYIYYNVNDLLGILALESVRNNCLIIGEDLGTVPDGMDVLLKENGVHSYRIFFFERSKLDGGFISPAHYPEQAMAALTTHDMPTLRGFWHCDDLTLGRELGLYPNDEILAALSADRHQAKQRILDSLHGHGVLPASVGNDVTWVGMSTELNHGMQLHMCKGNCALFSTQLEDWLEMDKPVNVPGTSMEYPNWRRKLTKNLEAVFSDPALARLAQRMSEARNKAGR